MSVVICSSFTEAVNEYKADKENTKVYADKEGTFYWVLKGDEEIKLLDIFCDCKDNRIL